MAKYGHHHLPMVLSHISVLLRNLLGPTSVFIRSPQFLAWSSRSSASTHLLNNPTAQSASFLWVLEYFTTIISINIGHVKLYSF